MLQSARLSARRRVYISTRKDLFRIQRQKEYVKGFVEAFKTSQEQNSSFFASAYEEVSPYIVSDCSVNVISGMTKRYAEYTLGEIVTPEGENVLNEYYEFHVDEETLDDLVLRLFYAEK